MDASQSHEITRLLRDWKAGDATALDRLTPRVYEELRRMARRYMRNERQGVTMQATALVNEVYLQLAGATNLDCDDRSHFYAVAANMMRRILVDQARARGSAKRGGGAVKLNLDDAPEIAAHSRDREIVAIDEALVALAAMDPRKARVIELRFFGGLSVEETAEVLKVSEPTVLRDWKLAKAWMLRELKASA
ncbi:MAG: sigma-70 family RNA polymerase sigma factor [Acidobacteriota bacterium]